MKEFTQEEIFGILKDNYDLDVSRVKQLAGYIDKNYKITTESGEKYILKLSTSDPLFLLEAQNALLGSLNSTKVNYPEVFPTVRGNQIIKLGEYYVRLLSFIQGQFIADIESKTPTLYTNFGNAVANMDLQLQQLDLPTLSHRHLQWDLTHVLEQKQNIQYLDQPNRKRIVHYFLNQFKEVVQPKIHTLRKSILHNDANPMNVLVDGNQISGFIDFGDMVYSCTVYEPAIALAYIMMEEEDPIAVARDFLIGYHEALPLEERELSLLYYLIACRLCTTQVMSAKSRADNPTNEYANIDEERAHKLLAKLLSINPKKAENEFREACGYSSNQEDKSSDLISQRDKHISKGLSVSYDQAISMESSAFQYMYDSTGVTYLDCVNNIMHVGHCHPEVVEAGQRQMAKMNTNTRYLYSSLNEYASRLLAKLPKKLNKIFFVNSGSAASDLAIRLAKTFTQRADLIVIEQGYHGNTQIGIDISSYKFDGKGGNGAVDRIHKISMPDTYRDPRTGEEFAKEVDPILQNNKVAAFIAEPILSCGGQLVLPDNYFSAIYDKVRKGGGVCIADETQVGFGRVGVHFWGFELQGVDPDIVIMGKPIGNGHPMAAVACTDDIAEAFENGMEFFSSFGGNPVSCEIGLAVLDVLDKEGLQQHAKEMGEYILTQWNQLKAKYECIGDVRGVGLFLGIEFVKSRDTKEPDEHTAHTVVQKMKGKGFLLSTDGPHHNVIKFKPPMVFDKENADDLFRSLDQVVSSVTNAAFCKS